MRLIIADCKKCGKIVTFEVEEKPRNSYPFSFIYYHGNPLHALISYIDINYKVRGSEVIQEFSGQVIAPTEKIAKKCIILGDWCVGKTAFIQRVVKNIFNDEYDPTVGQNSSECIFVLPNKKSLDITFWDAAGQHYNYKDDPTWLSFIHGADVVIIMGDVTKPLTFKAMFEIKAEVLMRVRKDAIILGVANKIDCTTDRKIQSSDLEQLESKYGIPIFDLSVKEGENIDEFLNYLTAAIDTN